MRFFSSINYQLLGLNFPHSKGAQSKSSRTFYLQFLFSPLWTTCGKGDDIEEKEERSVSDSESLEDFYVTADEGYDADVEVRDTFSSPGKFTYGIETFFICSLERFEKNIQLVLRFDDAAANIMSLTFE